MSDKEFLKQNHLTVKVNTSEEKILQQIIQDALVNDSTTLAKDLILIYDSLPKHRKHCDFVKNLLAEHSYFLLGFSTRFLVKNKPNRTYLLHTNKFLEALNLST